jgi:hypothetical protein
MSPARNGAARRDDPHIVACVTRGRARRGGGGAGVAPGDPCLGYGVGAASESVLACRRDALSGGVVAGSHPGAATAPRTPAATRTERSR